MMEDSLTGEFFRGHLEDGEDVLWVGKPEPGVLFAPGDLFLVPFSLMWGGFALAWEALVVAALLRGEDRSANGGSLWFFAVFGLIFVATGLYLIVGRHVLKRVWKRRTRYAVTNRRVISVTHLFGENVQAESINGITSMKKSVRASGIGTIYFGDAPAWITMNANTGLDFFSSMHARMPVAFFDVRDMDEVYGLVSDLRSKRDESQQ